VDIGFGAKEGNRTAAWAEGQMGLRGAPKEKIEKASLAGKRSNGEVAAGVGSGSRPSLRSPCETIAAREIVPPDSSAGNSSNCALAG